ncbi:unnamed protein product [Pleuronectes platessa]|uniref:Uncharacterized protein n=1 Tax=Pleuronectes platessa TaxID=8262 RepID=A0A9N7YNA9_PLEPL|nr:unnamed protein product [Pleuronectes platessa]
MKEHLSGPVVLTRPPRSCGNSVLRVQRPGRPPGPSEQPPSTGLETEVIITYSWFDPSGIGSYKKRARAREQRGENIAYTRDHQQSNTGMNGSLADGCVQAPESALGSLSTQTCRSDGDPPASPLTPAPSRFHTEISGSGRPAARPGSLLSLGPCTDRWGLGRCESRRDPLTDTSRSRC